jgi:signal transduction histidine kinase
MEGPTRRPRGKGGPRPVGSIRAHLVALAAVQIVLVWGLIGFAAMQDFRKARVDAEDRAATTAGLAADYVVEELDSNTTSLADLPDVLEAVSVAKLCQITDDELEDESVRWFHSEVHILRPDGTAACPSHAGRLHFAGESWFKDALASAEPVSEGPVVDPTTKKRAIMYAISIPANRLVVAYSVELDSIGPALDAQFGTGTSPAKYTIVSADRATEIASSGRGTGRDTSGTSFATKLRRSENTFEDLDGTERIYASRTVAGKGWHLYAGISTDDAFSAARRALTERGIFALAILIIVLAVGAVIQRRFVRPVRSLVAASQRFAEGDGKTAVTPRGPSELFALGQSFNEMIRVRAAAEKALTKAVDAEQRANTELREIDDMRTAFLMAISHELRTPLTSVTGYATFLQESAEFMSPEDVRASIDAIASQSARLERLLADLLDTERLARGVVEPKLHDTDVHALVDRVVDELSSGRAIETVVKGPAMSFVDPALVERILENLIMNAIKHTPDGTKIWVRVSHVKGQLHIRVEDAGGGVPDDLKTRIFEAFEQGHVPMHSPGTGVGLSLVSQFAKLHGGKAWVQDRRGGGASFRVVVPAKAPAKRAA